MSQISCMGKMVDVDDAGYLKNMDDWSEEVARTLASMEGVELKPEEMDIIGFMRDYYNKYQSFPILGFVCKNLDRPGDCVNDEFIDPLKAWKIAGLPEPGGEVVSYLKRPA